MQKIVIVFGFFTYIKELTLNVSILTDRTDRTENCKNSNKTLSKTKKKSE